MVRSQARPLARRDQLQPLGPLAFTRQPNAYRYFGIDFSGATSAGRKIWITEAVWKNDRLHVASCIPGLALRGSGVGRERCLIALRDFIAATPNGVFGADFPFSIHESLVEPKDWVAFVSNFADRFAEPASFRRWCWHTAQNREIKRLTEREAKTPFNPYNLRLYRQTYYGIRDLLAPLVIENAARIAPQQKPNRGKAIVHEVCAACTLKYIGIYPAYKGKGEAHRSARTTILRYIGMCGLAPIRGRLRDTVIADAEGDALDSIIAASAAFRAIHGVTNVFNTHIRPYTLEGKVFL